MGFLDTLPPGQRKVFLYAVPAVAGLALVSRIRGKGDEDEAKPSSTGTPTGFGFPVMPSADAIGVAQLAEFETGITAGLNDVITTVGELAGQLANQSQAGASAPPPAPAHVFPSPPPPPPPPPADPCAGKPKCIPGWPCAPPGKWASPITIPLHLLNRPPTAEEQAQGYVVIGVGYQAC